MILPEIAWTLNPFEKLRYGVPSGLTHSLFDPPKSELCQSIDWNLSAPELFGSRWDIVTQCADLLGQYDVEKLRAVVRDSPDFSEPFMRLRIASIVISLMRRGIAPRFSGLLSWRGEKGLLKRSRLYQGGKFKSDIRLLDLLWLFGEKRIDECFELCTSQLSDRKLFDDIGCDLWKSAGCIYLIDAKLQDTLIAAQKTLKKDAKRLAGMYAKNRMSYERKLMLAETLSARICASRVGALGGAKRRWARGAQVYRMMSGEAVDASVFRRGCLAGEAVLSGYDLKNPTSETAESAKN